MRLLGAPPLHPHQAPCWHQQMDGQNAEPPGACRTRWLKRQAAPAQTACEAAEMAHLRASRQLMGALALLGCSALVAQAVDVAGIVTPEALSQAPAAAPGAAPVVCQVGPTSPAQCCPARVRTCLLLVHLRMHVR